jgi:hypothetical protein
LREEWEEEKEPKQSRETDVCNTTPFVLFEQNYQMYMYIFFSLFWREILESWSGRKVSHALSRGPDITVDGE